MAIHVWTILCSKSSLDRESNNISLFDVTEQINIHYSGVLPPIPITLQRELELVSLWMRSEMAISERPAARVTISGPNNLRIQGPEVAVDLESAARSRSILKLGGIPVGGDGNHFLVMELRNAAGEQWQEVARIPLEVRFIAETGALLPQANQTQH